MFECCDRIIKNGGNWVRCGDDGKRCTDCGGKYPVMSDDDICAAIIRHDVSTGVRRGDGFATVVIAILLISALIAWRLFK